MQGFIYSFVAVILQHFIELQNVPFACTVEQWKYDALWIKMIVNVEKVIVHSCIYDTSIAMCTECNICWHQTLLVNFKNGSIYNSPKVTCYV